jgi:hypothetical protein
MTETHLPTPDEVRASYRQGKEAVVALFMELVDVYQELQARLNKDNHNSSKPPTSDGLKSRPNMGCVIRAGRRAAVSLDAMGAAHPSHTLFASSCHPNWTLRKP